jgi:anti-sigma factor RsiW
MHTRVKISLTPPTDKVDVSQAMTEDERKRERELKWQAGQLNKQLVAEAVKKEPDQAQLAQLKQRGWRRRKASCRSLLTLSTLDTPTLPASGRRRR